MIRYEWVSKSSDGIKLAETRAKSRNASIRLLEKSFGLPWAKLKKLGCDVDCEIIEDTPAANGG